MSITNTKIDGRIYEVEATETGPLLAKDLKARGWDGIAYMLTGKRGAVALAYRKATTGEFVIANRV